MIAQHAPQPDHWLPALCATSLTGCYPASPYTASCLRRPSHPEAALEPATASAAWHAHSLGSRRTLPVHRRQHAQHDFATKKKMIPVRVVSGSELLNSKGSFMAHFASTTVAARPTHVTRKSRQNPSSSLNTLSVTEEPHACVLQTSLV